MTMRGVGLTCLAITLTLGATTAPAGVQKTISLPPDRAAFTASDLPGYQLVQVHCVGCHSAHYVLMQPPTLARAYWENTVKRMKKPFGATFPDEDVAAMADYLVKTYGNERPAARK